MKKLLPYLLLLALVSCKKDVSPDGGTPPIGIPKFPPTPVTGSVAGSVVDENDQPVANAVVNIGSAVFNTDNNGHFNTGTLTLDKYITTAKITSPGYFTTYRSFSANPSTNYISIKLTPKTLIGTFSASGGGSVALPNNTNISFQPGSINYKNTGAAYSGTVNIYAAYIDPTQNDFGSRIPGSLMGEDATNVYTLRSTGVLAAELESASGEPLQLVPAKPATVKMHIPQALQSDAPLQIDAWSLDNRGVWIKEGIAQKVGSGYEFTVSHFSFWSTNAPANAIYLTINVKNVNGENMPNQNVRLTSTTTFGTTNGFTDLLGNVSGLAPANEELILQLYAQIYCYNAYDSTNIGPFTTNASYNRVAPVSSWSYTLTGRAKTCGGSDVTDGAATVQFSGTQRITVPITNGTFTATMSMCETPTYVYVSVFDANGLQHSEQSYPVTGNLMDIGTLQACGTLTDYLNYTLDGVDHELNYTNGYHMLFGEVKDGATFISSHATYSSYKIRFGIAGQSNGTFGMVSTDSLVLQNFVLPKAQAGASATFTTFGTEPSTTIKGTFNIPFTSSGTNHTLSGSFRVLRRY